MKIIHTADWHLGHNFYGYDRMHEHYDMLQWLAQQIAVTKADLLLIAGDLFDSPNPSAASQKLLFDFLHNITTSNPHLKIIITAGNHDSGARLEAPSPILESFNVTIRGTVRRSDDGEIDYNHLIIPIDRETCCLAVPYLRLGEYPQAESHNDGVRKLYTTLLYKAKEQFNTIIAMGHMHVTGGEFSSDGTSRPNIIGGLDNIDLSSVTTEFAYTALGHLHKAQSIMHDKTLRYSGAPLPMSFAERGNKQSITIATIENGTTTIEKREYDAPVKLLSIPQEPQPLPQVLQAIEELPKGDITRFSPYLEIRLLVNGPEPTMRQQIEKAIEGCSVRLTRIEAVTQHNSNENTKPLTYDELRNIDPMRLAQDYYCRHYGQEKMPERLCTMLMETIKEVETENINNKTQD